MFVIFRNKKGISRTFDIPPLSIKALEWGCAQIREGNATPELENLVNSFIAALHREQDRIDEENIKGWMP